MKIAILGGAGAMGGLIGGRLAKAGETVTLLDVWREGIAAINASGLRIEDKAGATQTIRVKATADPSSVGIMDMLIVFVKCYHTEVAVRSALPLIGADTLVLTLQNGWGNAPRIAEIVGAEKVLVGVTYHSATALGPAHIQHAGKGMTFIGALQGAAGERLRHVAATFEAAGLDVTPTDDALKEIWAKLALNCCTLPTSSLLRFYAGQLVEHAGTLDLMRGILREVVAVANAQGIALSYDERWEAITNLLQRASGAKASMLQDVEKGRRTEIDVINGAIVTAGRQCHVPTPYNETMLWLVKSLEETFKS